MKQLLNYVHLHFLLTYSNDITLSNINNTNIIKLVINTVK